MSINVVREAKETPIATVVIDNTVQNAINRAVQSAVDRAAIYADSKFTDLLSSYSAQMADKLKPTEYILKVDINNEVAKLSQVAVPFLGRMIVNAKLGLNTLLVGPAGCGKTFAAEQLAEGLKLPFASLCLTAGASETWLFGRQTPNGFVEGAFSKSYRNGGVFLADEIDAADPNMLLAINTALANGHLYNPISGELINRHADFVFVGAANTYGKGATAAYVGRGRLDAATLDRFVVIPVDYNTTVEKDLCPDKKLLTFFHELRGELNAKKSIEIVSTRLIKNAYAQKKAGVAMNEIVLSFSASWSEELKTTIRTLVLKHGL